MSIITKTKPKNYLNNKDLLAELERCRAANKMTDTMAHMLQTLTNRYASVPNLVGYPEDMRQYAMYMLVRTWRSFNPELSQNPFAFFTQCIKNSFYQYLNKEKRQRLIRDKLMIASGLNPSFNFQAEYDENNRANREMGDFIDDDAYSNLSTVDVEDKELDQSITFLESRGARESTDDDSVVVDPDPQLDTLDVELDADTL